VDTVSKGATAFLILIFLAAALFACLYFEHPPSPVPASAEPQQFSAERALVHLNAFASAPHPLGSTEHDRSRDYLMAQLTALGLTPEIQRTTGVTKLYQAAGTVENIVARWKGTSGASDAVALVAHYDSVPAGPGAGDDGAGVAAILEAFRALHSGPALRNDIILLFTDGEEAGLLGASAFMAEHSWAKDVRVAVNLEARGNAGVSQLFETSQENGYLVETFAEVAPHPNGSSLTYEIYKRMPNDTDMTLLKKGGMAGLNFGFIGNWEAYHTPLDSPQRLAPGSLQQHGENVLALARRLGNADLAHLSGPDAVFFPPPGIFIHYPTSWNWPLAILCSALWLGVMFFANGAFGTRWTRAIGGFLANVFLLVACVLISLGLVLALQWLHRNRLADGPTLQSVAYLASLLALLGAASLAIFLWLKSKTTPAAFSLGGSLIVLLAVVASAKWLPGGNFLFVWPLLASLLATVFVAFRPFRPGLLRLLILFALSLPALGIFAPLIQGFFQALGLTPMGAPVIGLAFALLFISLEPLGDALLSAGKGAMPLGALTAAIILFALAAETTRYSAEHPKPTMMTYALDADTGKAMWASSAARLDPWTAQYVGASAAQAKLTGFYPDWLPIRFFQGSAPTVAVAPPEAQLAENSSAGDVRTLRIRITSPRHARTLRISATQGTVLDAAVNGHSAGKPSDARWSAGGWGLDYWNAPEEGIELLLHVQGAEPLRLSVTDRTAGWPAIPGAHLPARPADSMPIQWGDTTMVRKSFVF
jgi:peptidase M28-like protein